MPNINNSSNKDNLPETPSVNDAFSDINSNADSHNTPNHGDKMIERISDTEQGEPIYDSYSSKIRLSKDKPSKKLRADGSRPTMTFAHPIEDRGLTVRERARLQTFPDDFIFPIKRTQGRVLTGNALPVLLSKKIAKNLKSELRSITIAEALENIPDKDHDWNNHKDFTKERMSHISQGSNWEDLPREYMTNSMKRDVTHSNTYRRLDPNKSANTVTNIRKQMTINPWEDRMLSIREALRLQSFPDSFTFPDDASLNKRQQMVADAVPPTLVRKIAQNLKSELRSETVGECFNGVSSEEYAETDNEYVENIPQGCRYCTVRQGDTSVCACTMYRDKFSDKEKQMLHKLGGDIRSGWTEITDEYDESVLDSLEEDGWVEVDGEEVRITTKGGTYPRYHRLPSDGVSWTLTNQKFSPRNLLHPTEDRGVSVGEGKALQSFPCSFEFVGTLTSKRRQISNAVPPGLSKSIAINLIEELK